MEKQITTVYVPTDDLPYFIVKNIEHGFIKARVTEQQAYLYTPEEHAAVQGYREALEKIESYCLRNTQELAVVDTIRITAQQALYKAEDTPHSGWISVEDSLPAIGEDVFAYAESKGVTYYDFASIEHNGFKMQHNKRVKVTHWQQLPKKP